MQQPDSEWHRRVRAALIVLFVVGGALAGLVVQHRVGCPTGGCPITGSPTVSTIYGAVVGLVVGLGIAPTRGELGCCKRRRS